MKLLCTSLMLVAALLALPGCAKKEITPLQRKQATQLVSEAQFAATLRDFARAEGLLAQAVELCPDEGDTWVNLGSARLRLNQRDGAKAAYKSALEAFKAAAKKDKTDPAPALQQVYVLALLGQIDDARALLEKLPARYEGNREVKAFIEEKRLDEILANPRFKQSAL
ncbi:tetratricopeptide repeat protein [Opitutus sp. ER46]|uniref:tetratricopeptide repeat protein n=1 Tax=Opitutus sp. ER46 TaxID=2161864 RepID=UPI000D314A5A|nr:tetratricopeptide repeat protein [Opitutus sp. ER46]PTX90752.1 hypothetical protein DB354_19015 [Opitutus sp. ER46]